MNEQDFVIDKAAGLNFCGGMEELYNEIVQDFVEDCKIRIANLTTCYNNKDWANYAIESHSIKATAKTVGATDFAEHCRLHEFAAKEGNVAYIDEDFANFMATIKELISRVSA
ncbi:MAG: Hpt domain-containing protein [Lachnospiraceae bacterium]|nr:Hpt domain-containing protein [Lachnospiraceae bacterium]